MPTIDSDAHVVETEHTWDFMDRADQKYRPVIVRPHGEGGQEFWFVDGKIRGLVRIVMPASVQAIFDLAAARDPRAKTADPQGFIEPRFIRELDQKGVIDQLYGEKR